MKEKHIAMLYRLVQLNEAGVDPYTDERVLMEDRIEFVKNKFKNKLSTDHDHSRDVLKDSDSIIDHLQSHDPSPKKVYTDWMAKQYQKGAFSQEDAYRVGESLDKFHKHKARLEVKDINQHSLESLNQAVHGLENKPATKREAAQATEAAGRTHVWGDDKLNIFRMENSEDGKQASIAQYGGGHEAGGHHTSWCTAADSTSNMHLRYSKDSPLYVIHEKNAGDAPGKDKVYQYHVNSGQFMDATDSSINNVDYKRIAPSLHKAWSEKPELTTDEPWDKTKKNLDVNPNHYKEALQKHLAAD